MDIQQEFNKKFKQQQKKAGELNRLTQEIKNLEKFIINNKEDPNIKEKEYKYEKLKKNKAKLKKNYDKLRAKVAELKEQLNNTIIPNKPKQLKANIKKYTKIMKQKQDKYYSKPAAYLRDTIDPQIKKAVDDFKNNSAIVKTNIKLKTFSDNLIQRLQAKSKKKREIQYEIARRVRNQVYTKKCTMKHGFKHTLKESLAKYSLSSPILDENQAFQNYTEQEKNWDQYCSSMLDPEGTYPSVNPNNVKREINYLGKQMKIFPSIAKKNVWTTEKVNAAINFWSIALNGTLSNLIHNEAKFREINTQNIQDDEIQLWYNSGEYNMNIINVGNSGLWKFGVWQILIDIIQKVFCKTSFIGKGMFSVIPSLDDLQGGGVCFIDYEKNNIHNPFRKAYRWSQEWSNIIWLRNTPPLRPSQPNYWNIVDNKPIQKLNRNNLYCFLKAKSDDIIDKPEIYLDYLIQDYMNSLNSKKDWQKNLGICAFSSVRIPADHNSDYEHVYENNYITISPKTKRFATNHSNLIFFTPVTNHGVIQKKNNKIRFQCSYYDPNDHIIPHVKVLIKLMVDNLRERYNSPNKPYVIEKDIHWISPQDINPKLKIQEWVRVKNTFSWHSMFGFATHGVCQHVSYIFALLWGMFGRYFDNPKQMWTHLTITLNNREDLQQLFVSLMAGTMKITSRIYKDDYDGVVNPYIKALIDKIKKQERLLATYAAEPGHENSTIGGKKVKKVKKVRKHQGIIQTGGNAGRLQKGYRYSGKKLKNGLPQIIKCKSKKC